MKLAPLGLLALPLLTACGITPNPGVGPNGELPVIARPYDTGIDSRQNLQTLMPAIVYDPDGCQGWLIDNGVEGYTGRRRDPKSGLPVCDSQFPPGTVVGDYRQTSPVPDFIPTSP